MLLKLKATNRLSGMKGNAMLSGTRKAGPSIPTVVGSKQVKKAASQPKPSRRASIYTDITVMMKTTPGKYRKISIQGMPLIW